MPTNDATYLLGEGDREYQISVSDLDKNNEANLVRDKLTLNIALTLSPQRENTEVDRRFLTKIHSSNPNYTDLPVWADSTGSANEDDRPFVRGNRWHAIIDGLNGGEWSHFDYLFFGPRGEFYLKRVMQEDLYHETKDKNVLDPILMTYRVAEAIAVGLEFAKGLDWPEDGMASFAFSWTGLKRRSLFNWPRSSYLISHREKCITPSCQSQTTVPLATEPSAIAPFVAKVMKPLLLAFGGFQLADASFEEIVSRLTSRRL